MQPPRPIRMYVSPYIPQPDRTHEHTETHGSLYDYNNPAAERVIQANALAELNRLDSDLDARAEQARALRDVPMIDIDDEEIVRKTKEKEAQSAECLSTMSQKRPGTKKVVQRARGQPSIQLTRQEMRLNEEYCRSRLGVELNSEQSTSDDTGTNGMEGTNLLYQRGPPLHLPRNVAVGEQSSSQVGNEEQRDGTQEVYYPQSGCQEVELEAEAGAYNDDDYEEPVDREQINRLVDDGHQMVNHETYHTIGSGYHSFASALGSSNLSRAELLERERLAELDRKEAQLILQQIQEQRKLAETSKKRRREEDEEEEKERDLQHYLTGDTSSQSSPEDDGMPAASSGWNAVLPIMSGPGGRQQSPRPPQEDATDESDPVRESRSRKRRRPEYMGVDH